jgi:mRNA-degrading endonuclease RelE of RelBE toxin-antitoxin system
VAEVRLARRAEKDLDGLTKRAAARVLNALEKLGKDPASEELDVKALVGRRPWRRLRVGDYRILFRPSQRGRVLLVARVFDRRELERALATLPD